MGEVEFWSIGEGCEEEDVEFSDEKEFSDEEESSEEEEFNENVSVEEAVRKFSKGEIGLQPLLEHGKSVCGKFRFNWRWRPVLEPGPILAFLIEHNGAGFTNSGEIALIVYNCWYNDQEQRKRVRFMRCRDWDWDWDWPKTKRNPNGPYLHAMLKHCTNPKNFKTRCSNCHIECSPTQELCEQCNSWKNEGRDEMFGGWMLC